MCVLRVVFVLSTWVYLCSFLVICVISVCPHSLYLTINEEDGLAMMVTNGQMNEFIFPESNPIANIVNGEVDAGPRLWSAHEGPIHVGCQPASYTERAGGLGGNVSEEFICPDPATLAGLEVAFLDLPGNPLRALKAICSDGSESTWFGPGPQANDTVQNISLGHKSNIVLHLCASKC